MWNQSTSIGCTSTLLLFITWSLRNLIYCNHGKQFVHLCLLYWMSKHWKSIFSVSICKLWLLLLHLWNIIWESVQDHHIVLQDQEMPFTCPHSQLYKLALPRLYGAKLSINAWQFNKYWTSKCIWVCHKHTSVDTACNWPSVLFDTHGSWHDVALVTALHNACKGLRTIPSSWHVCTNIAPGYD